MFPRLMAVSAGVLGVVAVPETLGAADAAGPCTAAPDGVTLVVPDGDGVALVRADGVEPLGITLPGSARKAMRGPDGTVWAEIGRDDATVEIYRVSPDADPVLSGSGDVRLVAAGALDGRTAVTILDSDPEIVDEASADLHGSAIVEFADGEQVPVKAVWGTEYELESLTLAGDRVVEGARSDLSESFEYFGLDAVHLTDWFDPTHDIAYNVPPYFQWPFATWPDDAGQRSLVWVEGPDWDASANAMAGNWSLVRADAIDGTEQHRIDLGGDAGRWLLHADFDGRFWVGTFDNSTVVTDDVFDAEGAVIVDTAAEAPAPIDPGCSAGVFPTIDHLGAPTELPEAPTSPPTTAADSAPPGPCGVDLEHPAITEALAQVPPPLQEIDGAVWVYHGDSNYDPCAELSYAVAEIDGAVGFYPEHVMFFHLGRYLGTATPCPMAYPSATSPEPGVVAVEWRWPQEGDEFDDPSGVVTVSYRWDGTAPVADVALPEVLLVTNGCAG